MQLYSMSATDIDIPVVEVQEPDDVVEEPVVVVKKTQQEESDARPVDSEIPAKTLDEDHFENNRPPSKMEPQPSAHHYDDNPSASSHTKQPSNSKHYKSSSKQHSSSRSSHYQGSSYASHHPPRDYSSSLDIGAALSREFRGTSPSVLENIATHPLLHSGGFEPLRHPTLSARSRKVFRQASDLVYTSPGLKNLLEVCRVFFFFLSFIVD